MELYELKFRKVEKEYSPERAYILKHSNAGSALTNRLYLNPAGALVVPDSDIVQYWRMGGGVATCVYVGDISDELLKPTVSESDFVSGQIKSKKTGDLLGYQG